MTHQQQLQIIEDYFASRPYYYTDGKGHFFANPSHRKAKNLQYVGRFPNAKEARRVWEYRQAANLHN